jgi:hypothetical protein
MGEWKDLIWFIVWGVAILGAVVTTIWAVVVIIAAKTAKKIHADFDKGFDSNFFKRGL